MMQLLQEKQQSIKAKGHSFAAQAEVDTTHCCLWLNKQNAKYLVLIMTDDNKMTRVSMFISSSLFWFLLVFVVALVTCGQVLGASSSSSEFSFSLPLLGSVLEFSGLEVELEVVLQILSFICAKNCVFISLILISQF